MNPHPKLWWYVARSSGLVAWWLVAASVFWGLLLSTRLLKKRPAPAWLLDLHRFLGALSIVFTGVHLLGLVADSYTHFGPSDLLVPFASDWRPGAVTWGVIGLYLLVAIEVTSLFMRRIPRRWWRAVHSSSFVLFVLATVHAFAAGADAGNTAVQWSAWAMTFVFLFLTTYRQLSGRRGPGARTARRTPRPSP
ncbi:MAG TPA: ferric reductase-like transmembrane domain-containing protein [Acidimicrobiales bacterium]|jgi:DMSO/TMAO reductase YedYZ heme-binding membrane subunit|nr:ferric reductase-like transmembrane domain-containing protein [Acidimicrobiales bacterium]